MADNDVFLQSYQELASFLQKIGQYDALRIVKKYQIDGKKLSEFYNEEGTIELTDNEKGILMGVMHWMNLKYEHGLSKVPSHTRIISKSVHSSSSSLKSDKQDEELSYLKMKAVDPTTSKVKYKNINSRNCERVSSKYFTYFDRRNDNDDLDRISYISGDYITALPASLNRFEQVTIDRYKAYIREDLDNETKCQYKATYLEVIQPVAEIVDKTEDNPHTFYNLICGFSCFWGRRQKRKKKQNKTV